jgi:NAD(P)-dependent dehydrogenase (short-subunit alcohol dehydrogenase family)
MIEDWYEGRSVVVTGCSSGIGRVLAHQLIALGAKVAGFNIRAADIEGLAFHPMDMREPASIAAAAATVDGPIDALFYCAGSNPSQGADGMDVMRVNFIGTRYLTDILLPRIREGGSIASIASSGGWGWPSHLDERNALVATRGYQDAEGWLRAHSELIEESYNFSKEAVIVWTRSESGETIKAGVRMNCICPGTVDTPMLDSIIDEHGTRFVDSYRGPTGRRSRPELQAAVMMFLGSGGAS